MSVTEVDGSVTQGKSVLSVTEVDGGVTQGRVRCL